MQEDKVSYQSTGRSYDGRFFVPDGGAATVRAGVMVLHGGAGAGAHEMERARMLAERGYVAFVPDLFGEVFTSRERGVQVITGLAGDPLTLRARLAAALECMRAHPFVPPTRTAAIGFCFGGFAALELARSGAELRAAVSFHGGLGARMPGEAGKLKASVLVCTGAADPFATRDQRSSFEDEMTRAEADWQMHVYANAMHGFTERGIDRPGCGYHEGADKRSWSAMHALFDEAFV
ncbi:MAG TPA: dienelactone hydrolase family protein [Polyangia bacterium]|nr:dienelactone hydrolase family protein [Polyangia bacterium]